MSKSLSKEKPSEIINLDEILAKKLPNKRIPKLVKRYLKKIAHLEEINNYLARVSELDSVPFMRETIKFLNVDFEIFGLEKLKDQRYTFAANHALGGIDGFSIPYFVATKFKNRGIVLLSNNILQYLKPLKKISIPINKVGNRSQNRDIPILLSKAFQSQDNMVIYPAGTCARKINGKITELPWSKTFITKSIESKRDVVPVWFNGKNSNFFYALSNFRKKIGIKANIEMLYLADELFKNKNKTFQITFGDPIPYQFFDKSKTAKEWAQYVREESIKLSKISK